MSLEEAPYNMKIHLFPSRRAKLSQEDWLAQRDSFEDSVRRYLADKGAVDLKTSFMSPDKIRFLFNLGDRESALEVFHTITHKQSIFGHELSAKIFYVKQGKLRFPLPPLLRALSPETGLICNTSCGL